MTRSNVRGRRAYWVRGAARFGHVATGIVYVLVGVLAMAASIDRRVRPPGPTDAFYELRATGIGALATLIVAGGLIVDALWQALRAWHDFDRVGGGVRGLLERGGVAVSGVLHLGLAVAAARLVIGYDSADTLESQTKTWVAIPLSVPRGEWVVALLASVTFGVALITIYRGAAPYVLERLSLAHLRGVLRSVAWLCARLGLLARGSIYAMIAAFIGTAAYHHRASDVRAIGGVLRLLQYTQDGRWLLAAIALGFVANGIVELIRAWHRAI